MKIKTVFTLVFTVIFFAAMAVLTLTARGAHNASLPAVTGRRLSYEYFPFEQTGADGDVYTGFRTAAAIETVCLESDIYVLYSAEKNGETRDLARRVTLETGAEYGGFTEVLSGLYSGQKYVSDTGGELYDGCEVFITRT